MPNLHPHDGLSSLALHKRSLLNSACADCSMSQDLGAQVGVAVFSFIKVGGGGADNANEITFLTSCKTETVFNSCLWNKEHNYSLKSLNWCVRAAAHSHHGKFFGCDWVSNKNLSKERNLNFAFRR